MTFVRLLAWIALVHGLAGFVIGLRRSRWNDELERGIVLWMVLVWAELACLVGSEVT